MPSASTLFAACAPEHAAARVTLREVRRGGDPFLLLPDQGRLAAKALALYPAQSGGARLAKTLLRLALPLGSRLGLKKILISVARDDPFARFLAQTAKLPTQSLPDFALLAGNPRVDGQRFVLLLFGADAEPAAVVKAGVNEAARRLLAREEDFLRAVPPGTRGVPAMRGTLDSPNVRAFALDFFPGESPRDDEVQPLADLLGSWLATDRYVTMKELNSWQRLVGTSAAAPLPDAVLALAETRFHPALMHGDFAPWNVKVSRGQWTALDWERGELAGVPGWDWFHFVMQPAVLVRRESTEALRMRFEKLLTSPGFAEYARRAGIGGKERALAVAYLAYCVRVTKQTEGLDRVAELERAVTAIWS